MRSLGRLGPGMVLPAMVAFAGADESAGDAIKRAVAEDRTGKKLVIAFFGASWCEPCHALERLFVKPEMKKVLDRHFVTVRFRIFEEPKSGERNTPGAEALFNAWTKGDSGGIPYYAILDRKGKPVEDCVERRPGGTVVNRAWPTEEPSLSRFLKALHRLCPAITEAEFWELRRFLEREGRDGETPTK